MLEIGAGRLDRGVRIERATTVRLRSGEKSREWVPINLVFDSGIFDPNIFHAAPTIAAVPINLVFDSGIFDPNIFHAAPTIAAGVEFPSTRQAMNSQQMQSEIDAVFTLRYRTDLTPAEDLRIVYAGRTYRIKGVRELGRQRGLRLDCTARAE